MSSNSDGDGMGGVGVLVVSLQTDQITTDISSSVSIRGKKVNPLGKKV